MNRIFPAAVLAIVFHMALLKIDISRLFDHTIIMPKSTVVTVTMSYLKPAPVPEQKKEPLKPAKERPQKKPREIAKIPDEPEPVLPEKEVEIPDKPQTPPAEEKEEIIEPDQSETRSPEEEEILEDDHQGDAVSNMRAVQEAIPLYRINPPPRYPKIARKRGYQGTVMLSVFVDEDGLVKNLWVFTSSGYRLLDNAAVNAVRNWTFEPGMKGNRKVAMWVKVPIRFELK